MDGREELNQQALEIQELREEVASLKRYKILYNSVIHNFQSMVREKNKYESMIKAIELNGVTTESEEVFELKNKLVNAIDEIAKRDFEIGKLHMRLKMLLCRQDYVQIESQMNALMEENAALKKEIRELMRRKDASIPNQRGAGRKAKFQQETIVEIYKDRDGGATIRVLAEKYQCSMGTISRILNARNQE